MIRIDGGGVAPSSSVSWGLAVVGEMGEYSTALV